MVVNSWLLNTYLQPGLAYISEGISSWQEREHVSVWFCLIPLIFCTHPITIGLHMMHVYEVVCGQIFYSDSVWFGRLTLPFHLSVDQGR